ncbi:MAG: SRPBCC family protein [Bacillota bacterium]
MGDVVSVTRRLEAARENVFRLWAEAEGLVRWIGPQAWSPFAAVDLRVGGAYRMGMVVPQMGEIWTVGQFAEVVPNHRLRFTWHWEGSDEPVTLVTVSWLNRLEKLCQTGM